MLAGFTGQVLTAERDYVLSVRAVCAECGAREPVCMERGRAVCGECRIPDAPWVDTPLAISQGVR
jgi:hypothetical protein